jgi:hypothetical protein
MGGLFVYLPVIGDWGLKPMMGRFFWAFIYWFFIGDRC